MNLSSALRDQASAPFADRSVALVHEWFGPTGGSEQVFLGLAEQLPHAQRFVLWQDDDATAAGPLRQSWLARTPFRRSKALALPMMPLAWRTLTREHFDVVISSSHAFAHTVRLANPGHTRYLSYVHTPSRYVWTPQLDARAASGVLGPVRAALRATDVRLSRHVHGYAASSVEVRDRIRRYWHRDAVVIYPPVDVDYFGAAPESDVVRSDSPPSGTPTAGTYLLGVGRWIAYKRFDLMIEIARLARLPLVLAGSGPQEVHLRKLAGNAGDVTFEVRPNRARLRELYRGAACLLYPAHEDFGIIPVEAQATGTPVLGLARGGLLETVVSGETGLLVDSLDAADYVRALPLVLRLDREPIRRHSHRFSTANFQHGLRHWLAAQDR